jgi:hypothetical protein
MTQDRAQRRDSGAAGEEQKRSAERGLPDEVAAEGTAQLQLVARPKLVDQIRRTSPSSRPSTVSTTWSSSGAAAIA